METVWAGIIGAMAGAVAGAAVSGGLALFGESLQFKRNRGEQQRVAVMLIATQIRLWLTETTHDLHEHSIREAANPSIDPNDVSCPSIPPLPFEKSLDVIPLLPKEIAKDVFGLIERKLSAEKAPASMWLVTDMEDVADLFELRARRLWLKGIEIYDELAKQVDWTEPAATDKEIASMHERAAKLEEIRNRPSGVDMEGV